MTRHSHSRRGTTLVELLVVLCILGILAGVTVLAVRRLDRPAPDDLYAVVAESLRAAVDARRAIVVRVVHDGGPLSAAIRADGSVVGDSAFEVDRFTGRPLHAK
jgi:prepilin-type N-terminal cleavage/methylation domain-containing protein